MQKLIHLLADVLDPYHGFTGNELTQRILGSKQHSDVTFVQRKIGELRYYQLEKIKQSKGSYKPQIFLAAKKVDKTCWKYFNAAEEPHFTDVMKIYQQRADGLNEVASTMEMTL